MLSAPGGPASASAPLGSTGGPLGRLYGPRNVLYVRNLSPLVTEEHLKAIFSHCAEVLRVEFKPLPGGPSGAPGGGRYCELEFVDSAGITAASRLLPRYSTELALVRN
ncbi:RNA recognition family related protein [Cyclospora cayetanensis]|uniref:RNA recognition family related protein n=1 Tax=Cyclospora cayetanensis TaxID=88456 RepID=A0A1D3DA48_9EIME|nr:RNA recognition family related protein [Cyclospora cayetanensis]